MKEATGDLFTYPAQYLIIPTNGVWKEDGDAVMGAGVALQAKKLWPALPLLLGSHLRSYGNTPGMFFHEPWMYPQFVITFPTKHDWRTPANKALILHSLATVVSWSERKGPTYMGLGPGIRNVIALPRVGCGEGGLLWREIKPLLAAKLSDQFVVVNQ